MDNFGLDYRALMFLSRERAAELRDAWRSANGPSLGLEDEPQQPCNESRRSALARVVARLVTDLRRRSRIAKEDPCSQGSTA